MHKLIVLIALAGCAFTGGCNTVQGFGEDLQWIGQELQDAAD